MWGSQQRHLEVPALTEMTEKLAAPCAVQDLGSNPRKGVMTVGSEIHFWHLQRKSENDEELFVSTVRTHDTWHLWPETIKTTASWGLILWESNSEMRCLLDHSHSGQEGKKRWGWLDKWEGYTVDQQKPHSFHGESQGSGALRVVLNETEMAKTSL